jgi:hypothetical protein
VDSQSAVPQVPPVTTPPVSAIPSTATATAPAPPPVPVDPLGRTTPHGCVLGFLRAAEAKDYEKAANYLDGERSGKQAEELAQQLKYLLDQGLSTSIDDISHTRDGDHLWIGRCLGTGHAVFTSLTPRMSMGLMLHHSNVDGKGACSILFTASACHDSPLCSP